ncbi:HK97 family phage protein [Fructilactobacillus fructivorans]|uniref:hypothetical protein n=1 Tax=Fructilactobacillus fructivorans TaxID=1614 RepID=UPI0007055C97|nr:hypothetical protein [Fructilactobacillus fructivorans]KRN13345.1 HK97 family phage protein [Fructilactobacillus fructivorans]
MADKFSNMNNLLNSVYDQVASKAHLDTSQKYKITGAGAKVLRKDLKASIIDRGHVTSHKETNQHRHLKDSVRTSKKDEKGMRIGNSMVGFDVNHAYIARFINDGTKKWWEIISWIILV